MVGVIFQEIEKHCSSDTEKAIRYYTVLFSLNSIDLSPMDIKVLAFAAAKGNISLPGLRKEFIETYSSSSGSLENIKCKLIKLGLLIKDNKKCVVNPILKLEFSNEIKISIVLKNNIPIVKTQELKTKELKEKMYDRIES
jgi:hypothetical protein